MKALALLNKTFTLLVILTCSFQMALAETIGRIPASNDELASAKKLQERIYSFATLVNGKKAADQARANMQAPASSSKNQNETFYQIINDIKEAGHYSWTREEVKKEKETKSKDSIGGFINSLKASALEIEEEEEEFELTNELSKELKSISKEAKLLKNQVKELLSSDAQDEIKQVMLISYVSNVLMPMRDISLIKESLLGQETTNSGFNKYNLGFDSELFSEEDVELRGKLRFGLNTMSDIMYHNIEESSFSDSKLSVDKFKMLDRDLMTYLKVPTVKNYLRASRIMTLKMMISQMSTYKAILGDYSNIKIPNSCQLPKNGSLPKEVNLNFEKGLGKQYVDKLLANHGLVHSIENENLSDLYMKYYMNRAELDPTIDGYSGLMPFESYEIAKKGILSEDMDVSLDDIKDFKDVLGMRSLDANNVFVKKTKFAFRRRSGSRFEKIEEKTEVHEAQRVFNKIVTEVNDSHSYSFEEEGEEVVIDHMGNNYSVFIAELMADKKVLNVTELIGEKLKKKLKAKKIKIKFPALYGSSFWRTWALKNLATLAVKNKNISKKSPIYKAFARSCNRRINSFCRNKTNLLSAVADRISSFTNADEFIPLKRNEVNNIKKIYPYLRKVWNRLVKDTDALEVAEISEYDLLVNQFEIMNPWARLRLSYLIAQEELSLAKFDSIHDYIYTRSGKKINTKGKNVNILEMKKLLAKAAKVLGIDRTFKPQYSNNILSYDEKKNIWLKRISDLNVEEGKNTLTSGTKFLEDVTLNIFSTKDINGKETYKMMSDVSYATLLTKENVEELTSDKLRTGLSGDAWDSINDILESDRGVKGQFFLDLYKFKGSLEDKLSFFDEFSEDLDITSSYKAKEEFLKLDNDLKKPIYDYLLKRSSIIKSLSIRNSIAAFCNIDDDNVEALQDVFYATTKAQSKLNEKAGLQSIPENVTDKMSSMTPADWTDVKLGLGVGGLTMAALILASTGVGAPLGAVLFLAATGAAGLQAVMVNREISHIYKGKDRERRILMMEELGLTDKGSSDQVTVGWGWAAFEAISILPVLGIAASFSKVGIKMTVASSKIYSAQISKNGLSRVSLRAASENTKVASKTISAESEVDLAKYVLGFKNFGGDLDKVKEVRSSIKEIHRARRLYKEGVITASEMTRRIAGVSVSLKKVMSIQLSSNGAYLGSQTVKNITEEMINAKTAETVAKLFSNNTSKFNNLLKSYTTRMRGVADRTAFAKGVMRNVNRGKFGKIKSMFLKMRYENLARNGAKVRTTIKKLDELEAVGGNFEEFILKNIDTMTSIFKDISMRKRELPYVILFQGGPHLGFRSPVFGSLSDGIVLRKVFTARARLLSEEAFSRSREVLGLRNYVGVDSSVELIKALHSSSTNLVKRSVDESEARLLIESMSKFETEMTEKVVAKSESKLENRGLISKLLSRVYTNSKHIALEDFLGSANLKRVLFSPKDAKEQGISKAIWSMMDMEDLLDLKSIEGVAYEVAKKIGNPSNMNEFEKLVDALRILSLRRSVDKVEIL